MGKSVKKLSFVMINGIVLLSVIFSAGEIAYANNLKIENTVLTGKSASGSTINVKFDISWDNSWRNQKNYDASWIFVKFSKDSGATWAHATLKSTGHSAGSGTPVDVAVPQDRKGCFLKRSSSGVGSLSVKNVQLVWDWGADGLTSSDKVRVKVFGLEMVYVPTGSFYLGDPGGSSGPVNCFYDSGSGGAYHVTSESAVNVGAISGYLYYDGDSQNSGDRQGPIPAEFPKGYNGFYMMKYEITQAQYRDFLNMLTYRQQVSRIAAVTAGRFMSGDDTVTSPSARNGIQCQSAPANETKGSYVCNLNANAVPDEADDGGWIACNYLSWPDLSAYADWAALRPFTELEFEKSARGNKIAVSGEYVWGSGVLEDPTTALYDAGTESELPDKGNANYAACTPDGPYRSGCYADAYSSRVNSGAGYYGSMDLSGNIAELCVSPGHPTGRSFTGDSGDGALDDTGNANVSNWPAQDGLGAGLRGGGWEDSPAPLALAAREKGTYAVTSRLPDVGGRCARTAQ